MEAGKRGTGAGGLIPGLPEELVAVHVVPRLPWYVRPVCRAISKHWRALLDTCQGRAELATQTRKYQLPLLKGLFLICTFEDTQIFIARDVTDDAKERAMHYTARLGCYTHQIHKQWRKLPSLLGLVPLPLALLVASSGMVYVWSAEADIVLKMDLGRGDWTWSKLPTPHHLNENAPHVSAGGVRTWCKLSTPHYLNVNAIVFNGKLCVPQVSAASGSPRRKKVVVIMYDLMTDQCEQVETWSHNNLRVLHKSSSSRSTLAHVEEELYGLVEHESNLELLVYDACNGSWRTREEIPLPELMWSDLSKVKLLNGDCFEPALKMDANIVDMDFEDGVISWFNSKAWVSISCDADAFLEGKYLDNMFVIRGSLYGIFCEDKRDQDYVEEEENEEEEDKGSQQDARLCKRTIMKGRIRIEKCTVVWEEVHEVGCFEASSIVYPSSDDLYTRMT